MVIQVEVSLTKVVSYLEKADIEVEKGQSYNLYECGHVFTHQEDLPQHIHYYKDDDRAIRSCPICGDKKLLTKYKKCTCGTEHVGKRVQPSQCCADCPTVLRNSGKERTASQKKHNGHLVDIERCFCARRDECLKFYWDYDTTPCLGCGGFIQGTGEHEPVTTVK